jgi:septum formation protein
VSAAWVLLRHGESTANAAGVLSGWDDVPLSPRGEAEATAAGRALAAVPLARVLTSDLRRAHHTAALVLDAWVAATGAPRPPVLVDARLRERHMGSLQGADIAAARADGRLDALLGWDSAPPGGESHAGLWARALAALAALPPAPGPTLLVGHGGLLRVLLGALDGTPEATRGLRKVPNATPVPVALPPGGWAAFQPPPRRLVLASGSPRRRALLEAVGVPIAAVRPPGVPEVPAPGESAPAYALRLAVQKAAATALGPGELALAADTVVHRDGALFEKPPDDDAARAFLRALAGRAHTVTTAWCVLAVPGQDPRAHPSAGACGLVHSTVVFRPLTDAQIAAYVRTGEGRDKAGGYGIQGAGAALVSHVEGDQGNVVGLPLGPVLDALARFGVHPAESPA